MAAHHDDPLSAFDWLREWFSEPGFRGCAFVNSFGELGKATPGVTAAVREHKEAVRGYLLGLTGNRALADQLLTGSRAG